MCVGLYCGTTLHDHHHLGGRKAKILTDAPIHSEHKSQIHSLLHLSLNDWLIEHLHFFHIQINCLLSIT